MTVLCTHRVAQMDFCHSLRMVRLILTDRKRASTQTSSVVFGFISQPKSKITSLINLLIVNLRVSVETLHTQRAAPQPVQQVKQVSQEGRDTEKHKQSGCVRLFQ